MSDGASAKAAAAAAAASEMPEAAGAAAPMAKASPKKRGRTRNADRPRIDIDDEIEAANKLSAIMKKLSHAAKMAERSSVRSKARLVKKCGKLSAQDMERLAILKRCGLLPEEAKDETASNSAGSSAGSSSAGPASSPEPKKSMNTVMLQKLAGAVGKTGSDSVMECLQTVAAILETEEGKGEKTPPQKKKKGGSAPTRDNKTDDCCAAAAAGAESAVLPEKKMPEPAETELEVEDEAEESEQEDA